MPEDEMNKNKVIFPESVFDTSLVEALAAADQPEEDVPEKVDMEELKNCFQEAGFDCAIVPGVNECDAKRYAERPDYINVLQNKILDMNQYVEGLESRARSLENSLRGSIEEKAVDKSSGLTNETKRRIAYEMLAEENEELQKLYGELRIFRGEVLRATFELENERRAFQLLLKDGGK